MTVVLLLVVVASLAALAVAVSRRQADPVDRGVKDFRREMRALAPGDEPSPDGPSSEG